MRLLGRQGLIFVRDTGDPTTMIGVGLVGNKFLRNDLSTGALTKFNIFLFFFIFFLFFRNNRIKKTKHFKKWRLVLTIDRNGNFYRFVETAKDERCCNGALSSTRCQNAGCGDYLRWMCVTKIDARVPNSWNSTGGGGGGGADEKLRVFIISTITYQAAPVTTKKGPPHCDGG